MKTKYSKQDIKTMFKRAEKQANNWIKEEGITTQEELNNIVDNETTVVNMDEEQVDELDFN